MEKSFPLQRTPTMKVLGRIWTGTLFGQIMVIALLLIGLIFMGNQDFNLLSILFSLLFLFPISAFIHIKVVRRGQKLMMEECLIKFDSENRILEYKTGFPNTMDPNWQQTKLGKEHDKVYLKGDELGGYHLRVGEIRGKDTIRLGLWFSKEDAVADGTSFADMIKAKIIDNTTDEN